jgi:hypothetical protein
VFKVDVYGNLNFSGSPLNYLCSGSFAAWTASPNPTLAARQNFFPTLMKLIPYFQDSGGMSMRTIQFSPDPHDVKGITAITASL